MARRIEIELTSKLDEGRYTWRAAGAREPRGTIEGAMLPSDAAVGQIYRAEVDSNIEGVDVLSVAPRKEASPLDPRGERIEFLGAPKPEAGVQVTLAAKGRGGRGRDGDRESRGDRGPRAPRAPKDRARGTGTAREGAREGASRGRPARPSTDRGAPTRASSDRASSDRTGASRAGASRDGASRDGARSGRDRRPGGRTQELKVSAVHRNALLATLRPEQLPVAEQLLRGGLPAVRQAIEEQNRSALAQGKPTVAPETILGIAEDLLPLTTLAAWKDRATAVQQAGPSVKLRDLRPVVTSARTVTLDEEGRATLKELQGLLHTKIEELRASWVAKIEQLLDAGQVKEALETVARPPDSATRCPAELAQRLTDAASAAMTAEMTPHQWVALLDAVVASPMRRSVKPVGIPAGDEAQSAAVRAAGHVPAVAKLLGMRIPPPPPPSGQKRPAVSARR